MKKLLACILLLAFAGCSSTVGPAKGSGDVLLVLGDSLSAGYGLADPQEQGWVSLMEQDMRSELFLNPDQFVVNASVSGMTSQGGLELLPGLLEDHDPHVVMIQLGSNDALRRQSMDVLDANHLKDGQPCAAIRRQGDPGWDGFTHGRQFRWNGIPC